MALSLYGTNLTDSNHKGKLNTFVGTEDLVERLVQVLCKRTKCSPCLIGQSNVLKTAIIEGYARRVKRGMVPQRLKRKQVFRIDKSYLTDLDQVGSSIMNGIRLNDDVLVYFDEVATPVYTFSVMGSLAERGIQRCIAAFPTLEDYAIWIKKNPLLERTFQPIVVPQPSVDETVGILKTLCGLYETHHKVRFTDEALAAAAKLSNLYKRGVCPDNAMDLIDEAGTCARLQAHDKYPDGTRITVTEVDIHHVFSSLTGISYDVASSSSYSLDKEG